MKKTTTILLMLVRLLGVVQLLVGLALWFGVAVGARSMHIGVGMLFVLVLWIFGVFALFALPKRGVAFVTLVVGAIVVWFGMAQLTMLPGSAHWVVRVIHLLLGLSAMGLAERLGKLIKLNEAAKAAEAVSS
jgi:hypothetical protein